MGAWVQLPKVPRRGRRRDLLCKLLGTAAFFACSFAATSPSFAACGPLTGGVVECTGDELDGVPNPPGGTTTLNVFGLTTNIAPPAGTPGIQFITQGANDQDPAVAGPPVTINFDGSGTITTSGAHGIIGQSTAGTGEAGGGIGEDGVNGGTGGTVVITNNGAVTTTGVAAIFANSVGGGGGNGGNAAIVNAGDAGNGGAGGTATINNFGTIQTFGDNAAGLVATSRGGHGGIGGDSTVTGDAGTGGGGGAAGAAVVNNNANITTAGAGSAGILARSLGGNGGDGGDGFLIIIGGGGGGGATGHGGTVNVTHHGIITTTGPANAAGIVVQSVGGFAGAAGDVIGLVGFAGDGNSGGVGGRVEVNAASGSIVTSGTTSYGILAQSVGGGGGAGGTGGGLVGFGGDAGPGGAGGEVVVGNNTSITTTSHGSTGIVAQSVGGGGGSGGTGAGLVAIGGGGGGGGNAGAVTVTNTNTISVSGNGAGFEFGNYGIFAQSIGGGGGSANASGGLVAIGGSGGPGGSSGAVGVTNSNAITSHCINCRDAGAIYAQSVGGGGGRGGNSGGLFAIGGSGGGGGTSSSVTVTNSGALETHGTFSRGIFAQSIGGGGGDGGFAGGVFTGGGPGGEGGSAANPLRIGGKGTDVRNDQFGAGVTVNNSGNIQTFGDDSQAIFVQSVGGGGGNGGGAVAVGAFVAIAVGGTGGVGGDGGLVTVNNTAANPALGPVIATSGERSAGVFAQSVGGGGGSGGFAVAAQGGIFGGFAGAFGGDGATGGDGGEVIVNSNGSITTRGSFSSGIYAESIGGGGGRGGISVAAGVTVVGVAATLSFGGGGGDGGIANNVTVDNASRIETGCEGCVSDESHGILASSIGGGGGSGGASIAAGGGQYGAVSLSFGGNAGSGNRSGIVDVDNTGEIITRGRQSHGILAQSIGGGGGSGGFSGSLAFDLSGAGAAALSFGGGGGDGGGGNTVTVDNNASITTFGQGSAGILAQSVGGGGGSGGFAGAISFSVAGAGAFASSLGGTAGPGSVGGDVTVTHAGAITTHGENSTGIIAQSIGGGGGTGGFSLAAGGSINGLGAKAQSVGGAGGEGGNAGIVEVASSGSILTGASCPANGAGCTAVGSHGIFAQSVGGGGGAGGFSIAGSFSLNGNADANSVGGGGEGGGDGKAVTVSSGSQITTRGASSHGIFAQSVGGGGGAGAFSIAAGVSINGGGKVQSVGGSGGAAGHADTVTVNVLNNISTVGALSHGVLAQSVGGGGGDGGFSIGAGFSLQSDASSTSVGGNGSGGGDGGLVTVNVGSPQTPLFFPEIRTTGAGSIGVFAQSVGGGGGSGGFAGGLALSINGKAENEVGGGGGGAGGIGGEVEVTNWGTIRTEGDNAPGVLAQSVGGGGGNGGFSVAASLGQQSAVANSVGGTAGAGSESSKVQVDNFGRIETSGNFSHGIMAQSVGGSGGNGGFAIAAGVTMSGTDGSSKVGGGAGGGGGSGGEVVVNNTGSIVVTGANAFGVFAQSVGGGGGSGGIAGGLAVNGTIESAVGGDGGKGGSGGDVTVTSTGTIETTQANSSAVFAQSVAGSGGWSGLAIGFGTGGGDSDGLTLSLGSKSIDKCLSINFDECLPADGAKGKVTVTINGGTTVTEGSLSYGLLAQAIAGGGGAMGTVLDGALRFFASDVLVEVGSNGAISSNALQQVSTYDNPSTTGGLGAIGLISQSIGGGGGVNAFAGEQLDLNPTGEDSFLMRIGGFAQDPTFIGTGSGGGFSLTANGAVTTTNHNAIGMVGQTIGGGGGVGTISVGTVNNSGTVLDIELGGSQLIDGAFVGDAGAPSVLTANQQVTTSGALSHGIVAQSIGGGGGIANVVFQNGVTLSSGVNITIGSGAVGTGGEGGNGGNLVVTAHGVTTTGAGAFGIVAQSIGGGGGLTGVYSGGTVLGQEGFSLTPVIINSGGGGGGSGGGVTVLSHGDVRTGGFGAHGIVAQSIGGGGGIVGNGMFVNTTGGAGPFAGSTGQAGTGRAVGVTQTRNVVVTGMHSVGIYGQSAGGSGNGNVEIDVNHAGTNGNGVGLIWAAQGSGAAVQIADGNLNELTTNGTLYAQSSLAGSGALPLLNGLAILGGDGNEAITNLARPLGDPELVNGTRTSNIIGDVDLGGGTNSLSNETGALFITNDYIRLNGLFANAGFMSPGDRARVKTTDVTGDLNQSDTGAYYIDIDLDQQNTPNQVNDLVNVTGTSTMDGEGPLLLLSINKAFSNDGYVVLHADGGVDDIGFTPTLIPPAVGFNFFSQVRDDTDLVVMVEKPPFLSLLQDPASGTTDPNVFRMGRGIDRIEQAVTIDDPFNYLINLLRLQPDHEALGDAVVTLTPHQAPHLFAMTHRRAMGFLDQITSCPADWKRDAIVDGRNCLWGQVSGGEYRRGVVNDSPINNDQWHSFTLGGQATLDAKWQLGFGFDIAQAKSSQTRHGDQLSSLKGNIYQASVSANYRNGPYGVGWVVAGSYGSWHAKRQVNINGYAQNYTSFDGIETNLEGVGEQPAFSEKTIEFDGISGVAKSEPRLAAFNTRLRLSHLSEFASVQLLSFLDIDGHVLRTRKRTETGVGLANLTYPAVTETAFTFTPGVELGAAHQFDTGLVLRSFVRGGVMLSPYNSWQAETQFVAAPKGLPPIKIIEQYDSVLGKIDAGLMLLHPSAGLQVHLNYSGAFSKSTNQHLVTGGVTYKF